MAAAHACTSTHDELSPAHFRFCSSSSVEEIATEQPTHSSRYYRSLSLLTVHQHVQHDAKSLQFHEVRYACTTSVAPMVAFELL